MPLNTARSFNQIDDGPDFQGLAEAVASFGSHRPYLLFNRPAIARIRDNAAANSRLLQRLHQALHQAPGAVGQELRAKIKKRSRRLIQIAFLALIAEGHTKDQALREVRSELSAWAAEETWRARPVIKSFLDCAEIAVAVALAYDWLCDELCGEEKKNVETALFRHVIEPALAAYDDCFLLWPKRRDNCTLVSNSGVLIVALAVLDRYPEVSLQLVQKSIASSWPILETLAPDGAWAEGLSYWSLAMRYAGLMVAALESTFGRSFGLAERPGFSKTGDFALHAVGTSGAAFNFGDSEPQFDLSALAWFAHRFKRSTDAKLLRRYDGWYLPFTAIWPDRAKVRSAPARQPTGKIFHSCALACFRNTWSPSRGGRPVYLAIKGGNPAGKRAGSWRPEDVLMHTQADAGSFILDGARRRWVMDLGSDDYDLPGYFDHGDDRRPGPRWRYYRTRTAGHNTLVIDGRNQLPNAWAPVVGSCVDNHWKCAIFDLSAVYGKPAGSVRRGAALIGRQALIQDEIGPDVLGAITWAVHTSAEPVSIAGSVARFRSGDDRFVVRILEPETACFDLVFPPEPGSYPIADVKQLHGRSVLSETGIHVSELPRRTDDQNGRAAGEPIKRLQIAWPREARRLSVALLPDYDGEEVALPVTPLSQWLERPPLVYRRASGWTKTRRMPKGTPFARVPPRETGLVRNFRPEGVRHA